MQLRRDAMSLYAVLVVNVRRLQMFVATSSKKVYSDSFE